MICFLCWNLKFKNQNKLWVWWWCTGKETPAKTQFAARLATLCWVKRSADYHLKQRAGIFLKCWEPANIYMLFQYLSQTGKEIWKIINQKSKLTKSESQTSFNKSEWSIVVVQKEEVIGIAWIVSIMTMMRISFRQIKCFNKEKKIDT